MKELPAALGKALVLGQLIEVDTDHSLTQVLRHLGQDLGVVVVRHSLDNGLGALGRVTRLEDTGADEDTVAAELLEEEQDALLVSISPRFPGSLPFPFRCFCFTYHHESSIGGGGNTTSGEVDDGKTAELGGLLEKLIGSLEVLGVSVELLISHGRGTTDLGVDSADVADGLDDVAGTSLTLGADHGSTLVDAAEGLTEVLGTADVGDLEVVLVDVVGLIGRGQDLGLVNVVDTDRLDDLSLHKVADTDLGHHRDRHSLLDTLDHLGVRHAGNTTYVFQIYSI